MRLKSYIGKSDFREISKEKIAKISGYKREYFSKNVLKKLDFILKKLDKKNILFYLPLKSEINVMPQINRLRKNSKYKIYVPFMEGKSFKLVKYRLPVYRKQFNIMEPPNSWTMLQKIDVAVVPVLGVDGMLRRVGFGKGMYDRFFESLPYKPVIIFVQINKCFTTMKLCEPHDIQADIYITPTDTITKRGKDDFRSWNRCSSSSYHRNDRIFSCKKIRGVKP